MVPASTEAHRLWGVGAQGGFTGRGLLVQRGCGLHDTVTLQPSSAARHRGPQYQRALTQEPRQKHPAQPTVSGARPQRRRALTSAKTWDVHGLESRAGGRVGPGQMGSLARPLPGSFPDSLQERRGDRMRGLSGDPPGDPKTQEWKVGPKAEGCGGRVVATWAAVGAV